MGDWAELTNLLAVADGTEEFYDAMALAEELREPGVDPALDTVAAWRDGTLVGFGQLRVSSGLFEGRVRAEIIGGVRPDQRGQGLGAEIMNRMEARALGLSAQRHPGVPVQLRVSGGIEGASVRPMLERRGYQVVRYYHELARPIPGVLPDPPQLPVRRYSAELAEELRLAHNDAFSTHWGSIPVTVEHWQSMLDSQTFRPDCSTSAWTPTAGVGLCGDLPVGGGGGLGTPGGYPAAGSGRGAGPGLPGRVAAGDGRAGLRGGGARRRLGERLGRRSAV